MLVLKEWRRLVWWPGIAFALAFAIVEIGQLDRAIATAFFYRPQTGWIGANLGLREDSANLHVEGS